MESSAWKRHPSLAIPGQELPPACHPTCGVDTRKALVAEGPGVTVPPECSVARLHAAARAVRSTASRPRHSPARPNPS